MQEKTGKARAAIAGKPPQEGRERIRYLGVKTESSDSMRECRQAKYGNDTGLNFSSL